MMKRRGEIAKSGESEPHSCIVRAMAEGKYRSHPSLYQRPAGWRPHIAAPIRPIKSAGNERNVCPKIPPKRSKSGRPSCGDDALVDKIVRGIRRRGCWE